MADWRFYGREEELADLARSLELDTGPGRRRRFGATRVIGRRGVGKTELLAEAGRRGGPDVPVMIFEIPADETRCLDDLEDQIQTDGLERLMRDMPPRRPTQKHDSRRIVDIVAHLIGKGVVVALDEFHHAEDAQLVSPVKRMIDRFVSLDPELGNRRPPGKLVLMGSYEHKAFPMFRNPEPLHQRIDRTVLLTQWPAASVLEMVAEQGYLSHPGRFLTLWTAYGGIPRSWHRFATGADYAHLRDFEAWPDDGAWRRALLEAEFQILRDPLERFGSKAFIQLSEELREGLLWLGRHPAKGLRTTDFPQELRNQGKNALDHALFLLQQYLQLVACDGEFLGGESNLRWKIIDNSCLFQLHVFPELVRSGKDITPPVELDVQKSLARLQTLEGAALRRFAAAWLRKRPGAKWSLAGAWRRADVADISQMAVFGEGDDARLVLGGCKRNPDAHRTTRLRHQFNAFLDSLGEGEEAVELRAIQQRHVLVSPHFDARQRADHAAGNIECLDIRDMAAQAGIDPGPAAEPESEPEAAAPSAAAPKRDDSPSFGM